MRRQAAVGIFSKQRKGLIDIGKLVYGYWDCKRCGSTGIRGDNRECPNCGCPRGSDTKFYMRDNVEYVPADKATNKQPDWLCPYCDALNTATATECKGCGASRSESTKNYHDLRPTAPKHKPASQPVPSATRVEWLVPLLKIGLPLFLITAITIIAVIFIKPHTETMTVSSFAWERSIQIEHYVTVDESDWHLPAGARLKYTNNEIREYRSVIDHYETRTRQVAKQRITGYETYIVGYRDLGNGMFEEQTAERPVYETYYETETYEEPIYRQEPVYATKYYYKIDRWKPNRKINTSGTDKDPEWGNITLASNEREASRRETYTVYLYDKDKKSYTCDISFSQWKDLIQGSEVKVKWSHINGVTEILQE